jgi:hypothetical protein
MSSKQIFSRKEAAEILGVHPCTIQRMERKGTLQRSFTVTNSPRYSAEALAAAVKSPNQKGK